MYGIKKAIPPFDVRASWRYTSICTQITPTPRKYLLGMWFEWLLGQTGAPKGDIYNSHIVVRVYKRKVFILFCRVYCFLHFAFMRICITLIYLLYICI